MFLLHCEHCGRRELRGPRSLTTTVTGSFVADCRGCGATVGVAGGRHPYASATAPGEPIPTAA